MYPSVRGYRIKLFLYVAAYVVPAALVWGALGLLSGLLNTLPLFAPLLASVYALWFGIGESLSLPFRVPGSRWQVPSSWIDKKPGAIQTLIWGSILGPGLITRNPYAGMALLPLLACLGHGLLPSLFVGMVIGAAHASARALGVLNNRKYMADTAAGHLRILGTEMRFSYLDGLALLLIAGALIAYLFLASVPGRFF